MGEQSFCAFLWHFTTNFSTIPLKVKAENGDGGKLVADVLAEISKHFRPLTTPSSDSRRLLLKTSMGCMRNEEEDNEDADDDDNSDMADRQEPQCELSSG